MNIPLRGFMILAVVVSLGSAVTTTYLASESASVAAQMEATATATQPSMNALPPMDASAGTRPAFAPMPAFDGQSQPMPPADGQHLQPRQSFDANQQDFNNQPSFQDGGQAPQMNPMGGQGMMPSSGMQQGMPQGGQNFGNQNGQGHQGPSEEEMEKQQAANDARMVKEQKRNIQREAKDLTRMLQFGGPSKKLPAVKKILDAKKAEAAALQKEAAAVSTMDELEAVRERMNEFRESWQDQMELLNQLQQYTGFQQYLKQRVKQLSSFVTKTVKRLKDVDVSEVTTALDRVKTYQTTLDAAMNSGNLEQLEQFSSEEVEEAVQDVEQKMQSLQFLADRRKMMPKMRSFITQYNKKVAILEKRLARTKDEDEQAELEENIGETKSAIETLIGLLDEVDAAKKADDLDESVFMEIMQTNMELAQGLGIAGFSQFIEQTMRQSGYQGGDYSGPKFGPQGGPGMGPEMGGGPGMGPGGPGMGPEMGPGGFEGGPQPMGPQF